MAAENLVIVESPAKAKTINRYLGSDFRVMATVGHIRDLPPKQGMVDPNDNFSMRWETLAGREKVIKDLAKAIGEIKHLWIATDPDREGEAIAWHLSEIFKKDIDKANVTLQRIVFHEITSTAVNKAIKQPRQIDQSLVDAYLARRALDYLVGFTLSPVLWRKLPGTRSAGRVQSVALRLISEREQEISAFQNREYWSMTGHFGENKIPFTGRLSLFEGKKISRLSIASAEESQNIQKVLADIQAWTLVDIDRKEVARNPAPPFTTSTLQQEASRKLGFSSSKTMQIAQQLYEGTALKGAQTGLITYMRTDSTNVSKEAIEAMRTCIKTDFGDAYLPDQPQQYRNRARNAQEAHEAIRPTSLDIKPDTLQELTADQAKLYALIWKRALASQMKSARNAQTVYHIGDRSGSFMWRANGFQVIFDGFTVLYSEGKDDVVEPTVSHKLPEIDKDQAVVLSKVEPKQHFTQPPPRFNEASLVRKLEELGIGRPSTYSSIMRVIRERDYVAMDNKRFKPTSKGQLLTSFLLSYFSQYVAYHFTAEIEEHLDKIANRQLDRIELLSSFWTPFHAACESTTAQKNRDVIDILDNLLEPYLFPGATEETIAEQRKCPRCSTGRVSLKSGRYGGFLGCSDYPTCKYVKQLDPNQEENPDSEEEYPRTLGVDPENGLTITIRKGPYGIYVQKDAEEGKKPKRASVAKAIDPQTISLESAIRMLSLPRTIGKHPESGEDIESQIGRFGPYVKHMSTFASIPSDETPWSIGLNRAVMLIVEAEKKPKRGFRAKKPATSSGKKAGAKSKAS